MHLSLVFFINNILLGVGLAMDAFSVSLANGMQENKMKAPRMCFISGIYSFFQCLMPLIGWFFVSTIVDYFTIIEKFIPWIALILLLFIGIKMIAESVRKPESSENTRKLSIITLLIQGIATSIDALSVGFAISDYSFIEAVISGLIIAIVTFIICLIGLILGKKVGMRYSSRAGILGGVILIGIGIEIFVKGFFF